jgi:hypothetical protein
MVRHSVMAVIAEAFLNLLGERWGLCRHSSKEIPFIAHHSLAGKSARE